MKRNEITPQLGASCVIETCSKCLARKYEGAGLGLPLAKHLIELHGGALRIESTVGAGTSVTITLPTERICLDRQAA